MATDSSDPARSRTRRTAVAKRPKAPSKHAYHHGDLRRALLDATLKLVEEHGPQGFSLRAAAKAAGVTPAATYHHFEDKDAMLAALAEEGFEAFRAFLRQAAEEHASSAQERLRNVGAAYVVFAVQHSTLFRIMVGYGVQSRLGRGNLAQNAAATYTLVREILIEGLRTSERPRIAQAEVLGWWSVVHGLAFLAMDGHLGISASTPKQMDAVVRKVLNALDRRT